MDDEQKNIDSEESLEQTNISPISSEEEPLTEGNTLSLNSMFKEYWIDYASDVILDRSVPTSTYSEVVATKATMVAEDIAEYGK